MAEVTEQKLADFESRLQAMEEAVNMLAEALLEMDALVNEIADHIIPGFSTENVQESDENT